MKSKIVNLIEQLTTVRSQASVDDLARDLKEIPKSIYKDNVSISLAKARLVNITLDSHMTLDYKSLESNFIENFILNIIKDVSENENLAISKTAKSWLKINKLFQKKTVKGKRERRLFLAHDRFLYNHGSIDIFDRFLATPSLYTPILDFLYYVFDLKPWAQWQEALRIVFLPNISKCDNISSDIFLKELEEAFKGATFRETEIYNAASSLIFDSWLFLIGYYESPSDSAFAHLALLTRKLDIPPLQIAHCIRDIAYGEEKRTEDLVLMVKSNNPEYREIFERCFWVVASKTR